MKKQTICGLVILVPLVACAFFGDVIAPYDTTATDLANHFLPPGAEHMLGTNHLGRDVLSCLIVGTRYSLLTVLYILAGIVSLSVCIGSLSGYVGGKIDSFIMRVCDSMMAFPTIILALFLIGMMGAGLMNMVTAIIVTHLAWYTRLVRSIVITLKNSGYVIAARAMGVSRFTIVRRHFLPVILSQIGVLASLDVGHMLLHVAGLSFLGLGIQPPTPEWGVMIAEARSHIRMHPSLMVYPGIMIFLATAACNLLGDTLRDRLDPSLYTRGKN